MDVEPIYCAEQVRKSTPDCVPRRLLGGCRLGAPARRRRAAAHRCELRRAGRRGADARAPTRAAARRPRAPQIVVPEGLDAVLKAFTKEAVRRQPPDLLEFAAA
jgi:hypothetical protein